MTETRFLATGLDSPDRPAAPVSSARGPEFGGEPLLAAVARASRQWRLAHCQSSARVERNEEHPVEGGDPWARIFVARGLGRSALRDDCRSCRRHRRCAACPARRTAAARRASLRRHGNRSQDRTHDLGTGRRPTGAARSRSFRQLRRGHRARRSPTARVSSRTSSRSDCMRTT